MVSSRAACTAPSTTRCATLHSVPFVLFPLCLLTRARGSTFTRIHPAPARSLTPPCLFDPHNIKVTLALDFADGKMIKHSKTYDLDDFTDAAHAETMGPAPPKVVNFASLDFVKAVQKDMIQDMPAPADPNSFAA